MNSRQLEYIVMVSEVMSFSEAAKQLYVSQPSLSQYVKKVEEEIGADIFVRTTPLKLTYEGEIFVRFAKKVLEEERMLQTEMNDIRDNKIGQIQIGAGPLNSTLVLPRIIEKYMESHPNTEIQISESAESDLMELLDSGKVDFLISVIQPAIKDAYIVEEVFREQYVLAVPENLDSFLSKEKQNSITKQKDLPTIHIRACKQLPYILQTSSMPAHAIFEGLCRREGFIPNCKLTCKNINTAIHLAQRGVGACFIPSSVSKEVSNYLNCYRLEGNEENRVINIIYRKSMKLSQIQKDFMEAIRAFYREG